MNYKTKNGMKNSQNDNNRENSTSLILNAATKEFSQHGLAGARIDRIAEKAGVNKAMIYYHFGSKKKLYHTIIEHHLDKVRHYFRERIILPDNHEEIFLNLAEFYNTQFISPVFIPIFLREIASGGEIVKNILSEFIAEGPAHKLSSIIKSSVEQGNFRKVDCNQAIASFVGMNLYYLLISPVINKILGIEDDKEFINKRPAAVVDLFFNGIKTK